MSVFTDPLLAHKASGSSAPHRILITDLQLSGEAEICGAVQD